MKPRRLLRQKAMCAKLGCGKTKFGKDYRYHSADDPYVPGAPGVKRLKPVPVGERNIAFLEHEGDELIDGLAALRDAPEPGAHTTQVFLTDVMPRELERSKLLEPTKPAGTKR
jgi:hypothetical protein